MHAERTALWERHDKWSAERAGGNFGGNFEVFFVCSPEMWAPPSRQIIPAARMKMKTEHVVSLSRRAVAILRELPATGNGSRYVFPGRNPDKPISNNTMLFALYRLRYKGRMTGHGFRSVASTMLNEAGFRGDVIERQPMGASLVVKGAC